MEGLPTSITLPIVYPRMYRGPRRRRRNAIIDLFNASIHEFENIELMNTAMDPRTTDTESGNSAASEHFVNTLEEVSVTEEMVSKDLECSICLEAFKENEKCVKLPCTDHPHYFHHGHEGEECSGIKPWLQRNNTCPVCRTTFPTTARPAALSSAARPAAISSAASGGFRLVGPTFRDIAPPVPVEWQRNLLSIPAMINEQAEEQPQQGILDRRTIEIPESLIPTNNTTLTPEQIEGLQNNTNITNIIEDNRPTDIIQNNIMNAFVDGIRRQGSRIRNEEVDIQRAIELSLAN